MFSLLPTNNYGSIFKQLDELEKDFFGDLDTSFSSFRTDIKEADNNYILTADLPGFKKEDIKLELRDNQLQINAVHTEEKEEKNEHYIRRERKSGSFRRAFDVSNIDTNNIEASYENGVLQLKLPKLSIESKEVKQIDVK